MREIFGKIFMLRATELRLICPDEFRKNALKFGWELWELEQLEGEVNGVSGEEVTDEDERVEQ